MSTPRAFASGAERIHGVVVAAFGRHYEVELGSAVGRAVGSAVGELGGQPRERLRCYPRGKKSAYACGDEVEITRGGDGQGAIEALSPRRNLLWRSDAFREKLIAANLSHVVIVVATVPGFSDLLVSRCIAAAESQGIASLIVLNKADVESGLADARARLAPFAALGYEVIETSALDGAAALGERLAGLQSIFVGQSGVGKSTLTNALIPHAQAATREISTALDSGKHTTTFARLYPFADASGRGWLIDSPGLQVFGLAHLDADALAAAFVEFRPLLGHCQFRDCRHDAEPGCALLAALAEGRVDARRFEHYRIIREEIAHAKKLNPGW